MVAVLSYQPANDKEQMVTLLHHHRDNLWKFPAGLLDRVVAALDTAGVAYKLNIDETPVEPVEMSMAPFPIRPYQSSAVLAVVRGARPGGILQAATGAGKTVMAAKIIQLMRTRTLFCVHTKDLLAQARREFSRFLGIEVGQIGGGKDDIRPVTVATFQTLTKGRHDDYLKTVQLAIFDECHHVAAPTVFSVRGRLVAAPFVVGLSASPWRDDGHDMMIEAACGSVKYRITASDLIDQGFLVPPDIVVYRRQIPPDLRRLDAGIQKYGQAYRAIVVDDPARNQFVASLAAAQLAQDRRVLVLVKQIDHGTALETLIPGSVFVEGSDSASVRQAAFDNFRAGNVRCLIGTSLCDEGVDLPAADALILAGAGASSTRALQRIGRVIRSSPGKTGAYVADIVDEHPVFRRQFYTRNRIYRTEPRFAVREVSVGLDGRVAAV